MDFGLTDGQRKFLQLRKQLLNLPSHLKGSDHPFKLKSSLRSFLRGRPASIPIWVDCDIIAVSAQSKQLIDTANMTYTTKRIAVAPDCGMPAATSIGDYIKAGDRVPKFNAAVAAYPEILERPYLNSGLVFLSDLQIIEDWEVVARELEGDFLWEQYAFNLICQKGPIRPLMLDPSIWNVHGELLKKITINNNIVYCDEKRCIFLHATSTNRFGRDVDMKTMRISKDGVACAVYQRLFVNSFLREAQEKYLYDFLSTNHILLKELNILFSDSTRRNDLCPCGSNKRFKHCHGTYL